MTPQQYEVCIKAFSEAFNSRQIELFGTNPNFAATPHDFGDWFAYFEVETVQDAQRAGRKVAELGWDICKRVKATQQVKKRYIVRSLLGHSKSNRSPTLLVMKR